MSQKKRGFKRVVAFGDQHAGHRVGLTPPKWQTANQGKKYYKIQQELWNEFTYIIDKLKPIDVLIVNGDCIDGRGFRSGGTELITVDRNEQIDIAAYSINYCKADKVVITRGTPYHTGVKEDWEDQLLEKTKARKIGDHEFYNVNGVIFDVSTTSVVHLSPTVNSPRLPGTDFGTLYGRNTKCNPRPTSS